MVCTYTGLAQKAIREYIRQNTNEIRTISVDDEDYSDLDVLGKAIGNARVVMLGEQDHGDAPTFLAKTRIIKYLHEKLGFNVLVFESDFFALNRGYEKVLSNEVPITSYLHDNLFPMWTGCKQFAGMMDYLERSNQGPNKLHVSGIDNQMHGIYSTENFRNELDSFLSATGVPFVGSAAYVPFLQLVDSMVSYSSRQNQFGDDGSIHKLIDQVDLILRQLDELENQTLSKPAMKPFTSPHYKFWKAALQNFGSICRHQVIRKSNVYQDTFAERDSQMAINLSWLLNNRFSNEKLIVWAANGHIIRNALDALQSETYRHPSLGSHFTRNINTDTSTYVLAFTSYSGTAGRITMPKDGQYTIPKVSSQSVEQWMWKKKRDFAFVDLKPFTKSYPGFNTPYNMNGQSHFSQKGIWNKAFDGIFYIKDMYPCGRENDQLPPSADRSGR
jgi:erythromycin esterase-like protein